MQVLSMLAALSVFAMAFFSPSTASATAGNDVAEIAGYTLVYQLDLPDDGDFDVNPVPYAVDASSSVFPDGIERIAYYLELDDGSGRQWVWVSMDAFTQDLKLIGVPTLASGAVWQQQVDDMNVESNGTSIVTGTGITTGNIEFWPYNYVPAAALTGIGGSDGLFDFNDFDQLSGIYGSMQVHNFGAEQTLLAFNDWGGDPTYPADDVGIGNDPFGPHPDWTFAANAAGFSLKRLEVWVRPTPRVPALSPSALGLLALGLAALAGQLIAQSRRHQSPGPVGPANDG